jgi:hypothetical protein
MDTQTPPEAAPIQEQPPKPAGRKIAGVVVVVFAWAVGGYCGWQMVIPLALAIGVGGLLKIIPSSPAAFRIAWVVVAAQALYMAADLAIAVFGLVASQNGYWISDALQILVLAAGLALALGSARDRSGDPARPL